MLFTTMFERAAAFSAITIFILFGVIGHKYLSYVAREKESNVKAPLTEIQLSRPSATTE